MTIQPNKSKFQEFQARNKRNQIAQLDTMISEFEQMIVALKEQIAAEEHQNSDKHDDFTKANFAKAARQRRENLCRSLDDLKKQREKAVAELTEIETVRQTMRMRNPPFRSEHYSTRPVMV